MTTTALQALASPAYALLPVPQHKAASVGLGAHHGHCWQA